MELDFTLDMLVGVLSSEWWLDNLSDAAEITREKFNETSFTGYVHPKTGRIACSDIKEGSGENLLGESISFQTGIRNEIEMLPFVDIHFHPEVLGPAVPSYGDLSLSLLGEARTVIIGATPYDSDLKQIYGVAKAREDGGVEMLFYQPRSKLVKEEVSQADFDIVKFLELHGVGDSEDSIVYSDIKTIEVARVITGKSYAAVVINYSPAVMNYKKRTPGNVAELKRQLRTKMRDFVHVIKFTESPDEPFEGFENRLGDDEPISLDELYD